jgi:uracil phosphoribosyltransferase
MIFDISKTKSIANTFIAELRDEHIQKDSMRFRKNMERLGEFFAYEISRSLKYVKKEIVTPLGVSTCEVLTEHSEQGFHFSRACLTSSTKRNAALFLLIARQVRAVTLSFKWITFLLRI